MSKRMIQRSVLVCLVGVSACSRRPDFEDQLFNGQAKLLRLEMVQKDEETQQSRTIVISDRDQLKEVEGVVRSLTWDPLAKGALGLSTRDLWELEFYWDDGSSSTAALVSTLLLSRDYRAHLSDDATAVFESLPKTK